MSINNEISTPKKRGRPRGTKNTSDRREGIAVEGHGMASPVEVARMAAVEVFARCFPALVRGLRPEEIEKMERLIDSGIASAFKRREGI